MFCAAHQTCARTAAPLDIIMVQGARGAAHLRTGAATARMALGATTNRHGVSAQPRAFSRTPRGMALKRRAIVARLRCACAAHLSSGTARAAAPAHVSRAERKKESKNIIARLSPYR